MISSYQDLSMTFVAERRPRRPGPARAAVAPMPRPDERYFAAIRSSRLAAFFGDGYRPAGLDMAKVEDRAFHDAIVQAEQERRDARQALADGALLRFLDDRVDRFVDQLHGLSRSAVAWIKKARGESDETGDQDADTVTAMSSDALWSRLEGADRGEAWSEALGELVEREDPGLPTYIVAELQREGVPSAARSALIFAAEHSQCFDTRTRASLKDALLVHALVLRDAGEEHALWSAVRRYASLVPVDEAGALLQFLRNEDASATKQVALQGIQNIFAVEAPVDGPAVRDLRARVHALAETLIAPACLEVRGGPALALEAFCAAASLGDGGLAALARPLAALGRPYVTRRAVEHVRSLDRPQHARAARQEALAALVTRPKKEGPA